MYSTCLIIDLLSGFILQWLKKLSQCFTVLARSTWHQTSILRNILKIIYVILRHLGFLKNLGHVIWIRIDWMPNKTKHSVIGTVFWPSIILAIHPLYQPESPWDQVWKWSTMSCDFVYTYLTCWNHFNQLLSFLPPHATYILYQALSGHLPS